MVRKPVVRIALVLSLLTLAGIIALASAGHRGIITSQDGRMSIATQPPSHVVPWNEPAGSTTIAGNLSRYPYGVYFCCYGWTISGPDSFLGSAYWVAVPFTPSTDVRVTALEASVGWGGSGPNGVTLSLNADANGLPGNVLAGANLTNISSFGDCCTLSIAKDPAGIAVSAGTQYWLVVSTSSGTSTTYDGWALNSTDMRYYSFAGYSTANGWYATEGILPGYAVLAK